MKTDNVVVGILTIFFASILFGDAVLTTYNPASMILSPNDVKGIAGLVFVIIAVYIFIKARE